MTLPLIIQVFKIPIPITQVNIAVAMLKLAWNGSSLRCRLWKGHAKLKLLGDIISGGKDSHWGNLGVILATALEWEGHKSSKKPSFIHHSLQTKRLTNEEQQISNITCPSKAWKSVTGGLLTWNICNKAKSTGSTSLTVHNDSCYNKCQLQSAYISSTYVSTRYRTQAQYNTVNMAIFEKLVYNTAWI